MKYQLHDSQINKIEFGEDTISFIFSQGFWATDEHGKMIEQLENCKTVFEIDRNDVPIEDFISIRIFSTILRPFGVLTHVESVVCLTRRLDNELPMA